MADNIATRVTRIISGSIHALLDSVEGALPEAAMTQAIREVDEAVDDVRSELGRAEAAKHLATSSLNKLNTQNEELAGQIELAIAKGNEGLARAGVAKQVDIEDQIPVLQRSLQEARDRGAELEAFITALLAKKREMETALRDLIAARAAAPSTAATGANGGGGGSAVGRAQGKADRAGAAFDRVLARETGVAGVTTALNRDAQKLHDLQEMARNHRIDERLAALKAAKSNGR